MGVEPWNLKSKVAISGWFLFHFFCGSHLESFWILGGKVSSILRFGLIHLEVFKYKAIDPYLLPLFFPSQNPWQVTSTKKWASSWRDLCSCRWRKTSRMLYDFKLTTFSGTCFQMKPVIRKILPCSCNHCRMFNCLSKELTTKKGYIAREVHVVCPSPLCVITLHRSFLDDMSVHDILDVGVAWCCLSS